MKTYITASDIAKDMHFNEENIKEMDTLLESFPMLIPEYYYRLIDFDNPKDPIKKMCIPNVREFDLDGSFDTSNEEGNTVLPGLQHKYQQTAMILSTNRCAMYCRHCFRKRLVGLDSGELANHLDDIFAYIEKHEEISNVLVSGGDAFLNSNKTIERYLESLSKIDHLDFIRFGTRTPVVWPQRITEDPELIELLAKFNKEKQILVVTHFNHSQEITPESKAAIDALRSADIPVRNQTVLLKGVNDDPEVLGMLLKNLTSIGVFPYYVFQCRPVTGVKNSFQVPLKRAVVVVEDAKKMQNGIGKAFRYCMSHPEGKIEILGNLPDGKMAFKFHEAADLDGDNGRMFTMSVEDDQAWLGDDIPKA